MKIICVIRINPSKSVSMMFCDDTIYYKLRPLAYCRYMDDFVVWSSSQAKLKEMLVSINNYVNHKLKLAVKQPVFGKTSTGMPFLGFLIKAKGIYLLQKSKKRFSKRMSEITGLLYSGSISEAKAAERSLSAIAAIKLARTNRLRSRVYAKGERSPARIA